MASRSDRVLITGATGFTGRLLLERFSQTGHQTIGLNRKIDAPGLIKVDLRDTEDLAQVLMRVRPTAIVHLAGNSLPAHHDIAEIYSGNVVATASLFSALMAAKIEPEVVILASSAFVYRPTGSDLPITENDPLAPQTHYGISKRAVEDVARLHSRIFPIIITRPFNYTGPGQSTAFLIPKIVQHFAEGKRQIRLGNIDLFRDFSDVRRVIETYFQLVCNSVAPTTLNICSGRSLHLGDTLNLMKEISGQEIEVIKDRAFFRDGEPRAIVGSPAQLENTVGKLPNPPFGDTLRQMYEAYQRGTVGFAASV